MPTISQFFGIIIRMFWREHAPPHFHALYGEYEALIDIRTLEIIEGGLPKRAQAMVLEWAAQHREELMEDWNLCQSRQPPKNIAPLE
ncbi:MAG: transcriptional regulator [Gallionellales bacterium RBG_16_57_15]|nr:MAG: transcriptional regulator [Gallionellales bacterium RBG_16_57_15]